jgi:hypothetical protein
MTTCYQTSFVPSVMLYIVHHMTSLWLLLLSRNHSHSSYQGPSLANVFKVQGTRISRMAHACMCCCWFGLLTVQPWGNCLQYVRTVSILLCQADHVFWHTVHKLQGNHLQSNQEVHMLSHHSPTQLRHCTMILCNLYQMSVVGLDVQ